MPWCAEDDPRRLEFVEIVERAIVACSPSAHGRRVRVASEGASGGINVRAMGSVRSWMKGDEEATRDDGAQAHGIRWCARRSVLSVQRISLVPRRQQVAAPMNHGEKGAPLTNVLTAADAITPFGMRHNLLGHAFAHAGALAGARRRLDELVPAAVLVHHLGTHIGGDVSVVKEESRRKKSTRRMKESARQVSNKGPGETAHVEPRCGVALLRSGKRDRRKRRRRGRRWCNDGHDRGGVRW